MISRRLDLSPASRAVTLLLLGFGCGLGGCANMSDTLTSAFADPAKYDNYDCLQLQTTRKALVARSAELQGLMAKAETGAGGSVVAEVAYRNDYISTRASANLAEEVWRRNNCVAVPDKPGPKPGVPDPASSSKKPPGSAPPKSGNSIY